ncbi:MAG: TonB-dependent receptor [Bacteroidales bacterium]|nr:TonB-dependent receptor [Bacteroidales bacterium]
MKTIFSTLLILIMSLSMAQAQQQISGKLSNEGGAPIEFANIVILSNDSTFLTGTVSDLDGNFTVEKPADAHFIHISCIGYETLYKTISEINDFQKILLKNSSVELDEITVKAIAPKTTLKDGAMVTNVQGTVLAQTGSTTRMLANVPGLMKGREGGLEVIGKGSPEIYINNVKVRDMNELESLSPENIKSVEVISSPGARYAADVNAVVRITTLKPVGEGFGFDAETYFYQAFNDRSRTNQQKVNFNYRKKGFDIFGGARYAHNEKIGHIQDIYNYNHSTKLWENSNTYERREHYDYFPAHIGANYQIDDNNFVGLKYTHHTILNRDDRSWNTIDAYCEGEVYDHLETTSRETQPDDFENDLNLYYSGKLGGFSVDFNADFVYNPKTKISHNIEKSQNAEERDFEIVNDICNKLSAQKLVLGHSLLGGRIDFGGESTYTFRTDETASNAEAYVPSVKSKTTQNSIAAFAEYSYAIAQKINLKAGVRYEHIDLDYFNNGEHDKLASQVYDEFFPSFSADGMFGKFGLQLAYSEKISRPTYFAMSNATIYASRYLQQTGNPMLKPTIIRNASITASYLFIQAVASYTHRENAYLQYQMINEEHPESEILYWINTNKPTLQLQLAAQIPMGIYRPTVVFVTQKQWLDDIQSNGRTISLNHPLYVFIFNNSINLKSGWAFEFNTQTYFKNSREDFVEISRHSIAASAYIHKNFLNNSLSLEAGVDNLFLRANTDVVLYKESGYLTNNHVNDRTYNIRLKYTFNPAKSKYKGTGAGNAEKERL